MKFVFDTYREIAHGNTHRRIHAAFVFFLWFAVGGYVVSTVSSFFVVDGVSMSTNAMLAALVSATMATVKFT